jgi:hypothetical protein
VNGCKLSGWRFCHKLFRERILRPLPRNLPRVCTEDGSLRFRCSKTVPKRNQFSSFGLALSEEQIPQIVENNESRTERLEQLEATGVRPRQMRWTHRWTKRRRGGNCSSSASIECLRFIAEKFWADLARVQSQVERSEPWGNLDGFLAGLHHSRKNEGRSVEVVSPR